MRSHFILLGLGAALLAGGCRRTEDQTAREPAPEEGGSGRPIQPQVVDVRTIDYAFQMPDSVPAGLTTFRLLNVGPDLHHLMLYRLEQGHTMDELLTLLRERKPMPEWAVAVGGPNAPAPGASSNATLRLEPGQYAAICVIPAADGVPHVMKGMAHAFRVTSEREPQMPNPRSDVTVTLGEYGFETAPALSAGQHTVRVVNAGTQAHEMFILKLAPGKTPQDLVTWVEHHSGPPPGEPMGGVTAIEPGGVNYFTMSFTPGRYGLYCFLPDVGDGKIHIEHGMIREVDIS